MMLRKLQVRRTKHFYKTLAPSQPAIDKAAAHGGQPANPSFFPVFDAKPPVTVVVDAS
jgi:hypothetical protein